MSDLLAFFGLDKGYDLRWAHAVNSRYLLRRAIEDENVHCIEVDVQLTKDGTTPICAHPPDVTSDLTLLDCVNTLWGCCSPADKRQSFRKALKLDFKSTSAVKISAKLLAQYLCPPNENPDWPPLFLNADILAGPGIDATEDTDDKNKNKPKQQPAPTVVLWQDLKEACGMLPFAVPSLGWTSVVNQSTNPVFKRSLEGNVKNPPYTDEMIDEMAEIAKNFQRPITFVFRACCLLAHKDVEDWFEKSVVPKLNGRPLVLDDDGDVVKDSKPAGETCQENNSFLLWSHGRDDVKGDILQQLVLSVSVQTEKNKKTSPGLLLLDLHAKHLGLLDYWELATYAREMAPEGSNVETMPSVIMKHVGEKFPNNKRFRYT